MVDIKEKTLRRDMIDPTTIPDTCWKLEDKDYLLIRAIQDLTDQIGRLATSKS
jgi:hypothetical protein